MSATEEFYQPEINQRADEEFGVEAVDAHMLYSGCEDCLDNVLRPSCVEKIRARSRFETTEPDRLQRDRALASELEAAAGALRTGRGLIGDTAGDVVREIWRSYPGAGIKVGDTDAHASGLDRAESGKDKLS